MSDAPNMIDVTIDDVQVSVPQGTLVIRAAEQAGIRIPRFCDHPLLAPVAACRQCLVEVGMPDRNTGELRFMPKPQPSCAQTVTPGMVVKTQHTSEVVDRAQRGVMEFLLINHPLDCPVCDKGGECPLQNQAMKEGRGKSRFTDAKRTFKKPLRLTSQILLDRERCILCQRCVRFGKEIFRRRVHGPAGPRRWHGSHGAPLLHGRAGWRIRLDHPGLLRPQGQGGLDLVPVAPVWHARRRFD